MDWNIAKHIIDRLAPTAALIDARRGNAIETGLAEAVASAAGAMRAAGLAPGQRLAIGCDQTLWTVLAYLGAQYAGLTAVPVERDKLSVALGDLGAEGVWVPDSAWLEGLPTPRVASLVGPDSLVGAPVQAEPRGPDDLAALMATSGTTGRAVRFIMVTHRNLLTNTHDIAASQHLQPGDRAMLILPMSYCFGVSVLLSHLWAGGDCVLDSRFTYPDTVLAAMDEYRCTSFAGVPSVYRILDTRSALARMELPHLRRFLQAGGPLDAPTIERIRAAKPGVAFYVMYGATEATARITTLDPALYENKKGSVGRAIGQLNLRIHEPDKHGVGEVMVSGDSITPGYWCCERQETVLMEDGWLRTGDLGLLDEDGCLWIKGRSKDIVKVKGLRVSLQEVDAIVNNVPGVLSAAACGVPHTLAGEALAVFAVVREHTEELRGEIRKALPLQWVVDRICFVPELPLTPSGKVVRGRLAELGGT
ncbi:class I adenylate-forming enzyme family protein [Desulfocurvibacter africanus]|uniref:Long-chain-fatty-acid--CoA ligase n=1 Tax=Desulfocurvibacter africanus subsp. africanus str. Walvis Bay TaxID=690850 RepID=F3Z2C6_DESAF|nr:class I adenylate-forming enzyme family protein [Desulfocurvibacter africanus]EGJ50166.1 Long-chain-fatty-acid--CoA ligase [Desulfocurvibacter africanus subsp. africanus str. Walvis Bay]